MLMVTLLFDKAWAADKKEILGNAPWRMTMQALDEKYGIESEEHAEENDHLVILKTDAEALEVSGFLRDFFEKSFGVTPHDTVIQYIVAPYTPPTIVMEDLEDEFLEETPVVKETPVIPAIEVIRGMIGAYSFKSVADEIATVAPHLVKQGIPRVLLRRCYLFAINDGDGLTTYLRLLARLLAESGLGRFTTKRVVEVKAEAAKRNENDLFADVREMLKRGKFTAPYIVCVDICEWMSKTRDTEFRDFLQEIQDYTEKCVVVFRVPFVERDVLQNIRQSIEDVLPVEDVSFTPFDSEELRAFAKNSMERVYGYTMEDEAWDVFDTLIIAEKNDGRFYGINTVEKVVGDIVYFKVLWNAQNDFDDKIIKCDEIEGLVPYETRRRRPSLDALDSMVGMEEIKKRIEEIVMQIETGRENSSLGAPCIHMRFLGNPGTGKTTVARLLGQVLKEKGLLRNGNFFEYSGRDLCGRYIGETAPKTAAICRDAYGSVLFIDEAYSLYRGDESSPRDYGREAIDMLVTEMENHRKDLVVIMAGYLDEMDTLMKANPGLASRMPYVVEFPNYTREQLSEIFMRMVGEHFRCGEGLEEAVRAYFDALQEEQLQSKEFSNARFVRNLFERTWAKTMLRKQLKTGNGFTVSREDFLAASSEKEFSAMIEKKHSLSLGFV